MDPKMGLSQRSGVPVLHAFSIGILVSLASLVIFTVSAEAQARRKEAAEVKCPSVLGIGVTTDQTFCDVLTGLDPSEGVIVVIPPHRGVATLSFELYNRHTYSEQEVRAGRAYAQYTAILVLSTMDSNLLARAAVTSEFRTVDDLIDRIGGGAGFGGVKAVAPTGQERVVLSVPADVNEVSLLGERLDVVRFDERDTFVVPGRPIAIISNVEVDYRPR